MRVKRAFFAVLAGSLKWALLVPTLGLKKNCLRPIDKQVLKKYIVVHKCAETMRKN